MAKRGSRPWAGLLARAGGALLLPAVLATAAAAQTPPRDSCARLAGMFVRADEIGLPTSGAVVQSASFVAAGAADNPHGEYCAVRGLIVPASAAAPNMEFQVNLPSEWNGKALQLGGGGYDGTLVTGLGPAGLQPAEAPSALRQGFATLGSDGGHKGAPGFDGSFGLNDEALLNFGQQSVKKTHDVAAAIIRARYGAAPRRFYFIGNSQGGHEALDAAARYAADYDGVVANYPAYNVTLLHLGSLNAGQALYGEGGAGWINPAKTRLITDAVFAACDGLDGAADGLISNVAGCNAAFGVATLRERLRCPEGRDAGDGCLSDAQIAAVERIASPYRPGFPIAGMAEFPRWALLEGARFEGRSTFGTRPVPNNPPTAEDALLFNAGAATVQFIVTRQPGFDALRFDPAAWRARLEESGRIMDVTDISLAPFRARGGKIILLHGTADDFITPHNTVNYYERQRAAFGQEGLDGFLRFFVIPGLGHGFGAFNARYDGLGLLDRWVESGEAPDAPVARDGNPGANRSRPMCRYPSWPRFEGSGSPDDAASFRCVVP
ncbi:tannase/feruloyl esterase family alpha/beta hydrolase [Roseomonas sp. BN140053]|uniref:tannase/feruloyl esterase family alpha/beta hydrolase n=1 Tax=Roseomonas sp. BN140053 TaxID=3391898 RepID=UPI0039E834FD